MNLIRGVPDDPDFLLARKIVFAIDEMMDAKMEDAKINGRVSVAEDFTEYGKVARTHLLDSRSKVMDLLTEAIKHGR